MLVLSQFAGDFNMTALEKPLPRLGPVLASPIRECIRTELSLQIDPKETTVD
jgi:hypothetical protein